MSTEQNKSIVRRYIEEAWNKGNVSIMDELMTADYARYTPGGVLDRASQKQRINGFRAAFPDLHLNIKDMLAERDRVMFRVTVTGTHQNPFQGIPPAGQQVSVEGIDVARLSGGKIVEQWGVVDLFTLLKQLGAISAPG